VVVLKAVLLVVANRRMAWTVVSFSSFSSLCFFSSTLFPSVSVFSFYFSRCCCRLREWWQLEGVMMTWRRWLFPAVAGSVLLLFFPSVPWRKFLPFPSMVFFPLTAVLLLLAALMVVEWRRFQGVRHVSSSPPCRDPSLCFFSSWFASVCFASLFLSLCFSASSSKWWF